MHHKYLLQKSDYVELVMKDVIKYGLLLVIFISILFIFYKLNTYLLNTKFSQNIISKLSNINYNQTNNKLIIASNLSLSLICAITFIVVDYAIIIAASLALTIKVYMYMF